MFKLPTASYPYWILGLCMNIIQFIGAQTVYESIDLTLASGETMLQSLQITVPNLVTNTERSIITMIQVSTKIVTQVQTVTETASGTCAATSPLLARPSATQQAPSQPTPDSISSIEMSTLASSISVNINPSPAATQLSSSSSPQTPSATSTQSPTAPPTPCDCKCLCPASAFSIPKPKTASPSSVGSTFKTIVSVVTPGQSVPPLASLETPPLETIAPVTATPETASSPNLFAQSTVKPSSISSGLILQTSAKPSSPIIAAALTSLRNATWTPPRPTSNTKPSGADVFNMNTLSLYSSLSVPLNIRGLAPAGSP